MDLNEWMSRFAGCNIWWDNHPTTAVMEVYQYFQIDLWAAWEKSRYLGAREVLAEAVRRMELRSGVCVGHWFIDNCYNYPPGVVVVSVSDSGCMTNGYQRRWEEGNFLVCGEPAEEIVWHTHDGYGEESGAVEVWAWHRE